METDQMAKKVSQMIEVALMTCVPAQRYKENDRFYQQMKRQRKAPAKLINIYTLLFYSDVFYF
jgi:hypothetical protein